MAQFSLAFFFIMENCVNYALNVSFHICDLACLWWLYTLRSTLMRNRGLNELCFLIIKMFFVSFFDTQVDEWIGLRKLINKRIHCITQPFSVHIPDQEAHFKDILSRHIEATKHLTLRCSRFYLVEWCMLFLWFYEYYITLSMFLIVEALVMNDFAFALAFPSIQQVSCVSVPFLAVWL
jgi:hypothetical protein